MPGDIGERFLGDAIEHRSLGTVQLFNPAERKAREANGRPVRFAKSFM